MMFLTLLFYSIRSEETLPSGIPLSKLEEEMDNYTQKYIGKSSPGASIIIMKNGQTVFSKGYGYSNVEQKKPVTNDQLFEWGSISKTLTFACVMQLVESGRIDLKADIRTYLGADFFKKIKYSDNITMLNLMHHNAGWEETRSGLAVKTTNSIPSLKECLQKNEPNQFAKPGTYISYSNYGVMIAGYIVEVVAKMPFHEYMKKHIFDVLNMSRSTIDPSMSDNAYVKANRDVIGYTASTKGFIPSAFPTAVIVGYPAGACVGPVTDLAKFVAAITPRGGFHSPLFSDPQTLTFFLNISNTYSPTAPGNAHGIWEDFYLSNDKSREHGGTTFAFTAYFAMLPSNGWSYISLTNCASHGGLTRGIRNFLFGLEPVSPNYTHQKQAKKHSGLYMSSRRSWNGFTTLIEQSIGAVPVVSVDDHTIQFSGGVFHEFAPNTYRFTNASIPTSTNVIYFDMDGNSVKRLCIGPIDYLPLSYVRYIWIMASTSCLSVMILWTLVTLFYFIIYGIYSLIKFDGKKWTMPFIVANLLNITTFIQAFLYILLIMKFDGFMQVDDIKGKFTGEITAHIINWILIIIATIIMFKNRKPENNGDVVLAHLDQENPNDDAQQEKEKSLDFFFFGSLGCASLFNLMALSWGFLK